MILLVHIIPFASSLRQEPCWVGREYPLLASNLSEKRTLSSADEEEDKDSHRGNGGRQGPRLTCKLEKQVGRRTWWWDYDHDGDYYSLLASNISSLVQMRKMIIKGIVEDVNVVIMIRDWTNYYRAHDFSPCNSVQCSKGLGKELAGLSGALSLIGKCFTFLWIVMFPTPQQSWVALSHFWNTSTLYLFVFDMWHRSLSLSPSLSHFWETYQGGNRAWESQEGGKCRCGREITAQSDIFCKQATY